MRICVCDCFLQAQQLCEWHFWSVWLPFLIVYGCGCLEKCKMNLRKTEEWQLTNTTPTPESGSKTSELYSTCQCNCEIVTVTKLLNGRILRYGEVVFKCPAVSYNQGIYLDLTTLQLNTSYFITSWRTSIVTILYQLHK